MSLIREAADSLFTRVLVPNNMGCLVISGFTCNPTPHIQWVFTGVQRQGLDILIQRWKGFWRLMRIEALSSVQMKGGLIAGKCKDYILIYLQRSHFYELGICPPRSSKYVSFARCRHSYYDICCVQACCSCLWGCCWQIFEVWARWSRCQCADGLWGWSGGMSFLSIQQIKYYRPWNFLTKTIHFCLQEMSQYYHNAEVNVQRWQLHLHWSSCPVYKVLHGVFLIKQQQIWKFQISSYLN